MVLCVQIKVKVLGSLKKSAGMDLYEFNVDEKTDLLGVFKELFSNNKDLELNLWDNVTSNYMPNALVLVNGVEASNLWGLKTPITEGSEIIILTVTHGG
jgi:molybdopterin converting factor small subunit